MVNEITFKDLEYVLQADNDYHMSARTFRYYQTKGMVPSPLRTTREEGAVYDKDEVFLCLMIITNLKVMFNMTIDKSQKIIENYKKNLRDLRDVMDFVVNEYGGKKVFENSDDRSQYHATCQFVRSKVAAEFLKGTDLDQIDPIAYVNAPGKWFKR